MLFTNAQAFRLTRTFDLTADALADGLSSCSFVRSSGLRPNSFGWVPPTGDPESPLVREIAGRYLICARREDKVVPASALSEAVAERVARIEGAESRKLSRRERASLRDDTLASLLPQALPRAKQILGYISPEEDLLVVGSAIAAETERFCEILRDSLGSFPCTLPQVSRIPSELFTQWLTTGNLPQHFGLGDGCDLIDLETGATVRCRRQDLATSEVRAHVDAGKVCSSLRVKWYGDLEVTLDQDLAFRALRFSSTNDTPRDDEDPLARLDTAFSDLSLELSRFIPALVAALGGERTD